MPMLSLLLFLALQDDIIGWHCSAERAVDGRVYRLVQSIEGEHRFPRDFRVDWMSEPFSVERSVGWTDFQGMPPGAPRSINFRVPVSRRASRPLLRILTPDGTAQLLSDASRWSVSSSSTTNHVYFLSMDRDLNGQLWAARTFRVVAEDRRGRVLGTLDIGLPDPVEATRLAAELAREVDRKLDDPANPANQCSAYGSEAYADPV
jgi:hypothetical protein